MALTLPPVKEGALVTFDHFPTAQQCFVYRNWDMIPIERLAEVLRTTVENVAQLAKDMGLGAQNVNPKWFVAGYITIIKQNWQLLTYPQLMQLLDWSEEKLAFIIKEDDFLNVKLGNFKPDCPELVYRPLTAEEAYRTMAVKASTRAALDSFDDVTVEPFDFAKMFGRNVGGKSATICGPERFDTRIVYSYCALYGDTFTGDTQLMSFPDELLEAYQSVGVNGIWCQAVLYTLIPYKYMPELSEGWEERVAGLRQLTERLDKYGIKLYLYMNEPRAMPLNFFEKYPELKGAVRGDNASLCTSNPEVQKYIYDGAAALVKSAPLLGGFITITASENQTNCYSHFNEDNQNCPVCAKRSKAEVVAEVNTLLYQGAASVNPDFKLIAWTWAWVEEVAHDAVNLMDKKIGVMAVSERGIPKTYDNTTTKVDDYSISVVGPGEYAKNIWNQAKDAGHRAYAKCQFNNTWECAGVPFLPVFEKSYQHITGLVESGVGGLMLDWTLGGYPSPTFAMLKPFFYDIGHIPTLDEIYANVFPEESLEIVKKACHLFSDAYDKYPFNYSGCYCGVHNLGVGSLNYAKKTGFVATMVCFPYDDIDRWKSSFPEETFEKYFGMMTDEWAEGLEVLKQLPTELIDANPVLKELWDSAEAAYCNLRTEYLQFRFVRMRDGRTEGVDMIANLNEQIEITTRCANIAAHNPTIGYESSNHYYINRASLCEKIVNCNYVKSVLGK